MSAVLMAVGDASGDLPAADFVRALARRRPGTRFAGMGGKVTAAAGVDVLVDQGELAVGGLFELGRGLAGVARAWRAMGDALESTRPDLVVLVDSGGFNLPFAKRVRARCDAKILYYIAPQVWAWRPGRIRKIASRVDRLAVIFPFEAAVYSKTHLPVDFVGHPLVESLRRLSSEVDQKLARRQLGLGAEGRAVVLLPGSRSNEVAQHLKVQLEVVRRLHSIDSELDYVMALAPSIDVSAVKADIERAALPRQITIVTGQTREAILASDVALAKPGTVTVEAALLERPMVVMGRVNALTAMVLRRAVSARFYAMPNLIAEREIVPELLQQDATPDRIAQALASLLEGPARSRQLEALAEVRDRLGSGGAADSAAAIAEEMLEAG